jgi:hypothetical protein
MHEYRQALMRLRQGDSEREIARSGLMGRSQGGPLPRAGPAQGWLEPSAPCPPDAEIAAALAPPRLPADGPVGDCRVPPAGRAVARPGRLRRGDPHHAQARARVHGPLLQRPPPDRRQIGRELPPDTTVRLTFEPGEAAQVDFGAGPELVDPATGRASPHLGLRDDARLLAAPVRGVRVGPERAHLARLPPARLRVVRRGAGAAHHRQRQVRHHPRLRPRPRGAAGLRRVRRGLRLPDRRLPAARPAEEGHRRGRREVREGQLPAHPQLPRLADLNAQVREWVLQVAGQRIHGTTRVRRWRASRWSARLAAAAGGAAGSGHLAPVTVHRDCHVSFERALYSVPFALVGKAPVAAGHRQRGDGLSGLPAGRHHARARRPGERRTVTDHLPPEAPAFFAHDRSLVSAAGRRRSGRPVPG